MNRTLTRELVRSNHKLALALLQKSGAIACANACAPVYPFPPEHHASWQTTAGMLLIENAAKCEMSIHSMRMSPGAAAVVLFPAEWRKTATDSARARLHTEREPRRLVEKLICQYMEENTCSEAHAILQLSAASVHDLPMPGASAYLTYSKHGCSISTNVVDILKPDETNLISMHDELSADEQLTFLVLSDDMASLYKRIAHQQPLAIATQDVQLRDCMARCTACCGSWDTDAHGNSTDIWMCTFPGCGEMIHDSCLGCRPTPSCTWHGDYVRLDHNSRHVGRAAVATGLVPMHGAWYVNISYWGQTKRAVGCLHPTSLDSIIQKTDQHIHAGRWTRQLGACAGPRRLCDTIHAIHRLAHVHITHEEPSTATETLEVPLEDDLGVVCGPDMDSLGQTSTEIGNGCCLSHGTAHMLALLEVYSEPAYTQMIQRLEAYNESHIDDIIFRWMKLGLPLMPGYYRRGDGSARDMHKEAFSAILSPRTFPRALAAGRQVRHWVVPQITEVLPESEAEEAKFLTMLGVAVQLPPPVKLARPAASPDVDSDTIARVSTRPTYMPFAVRLTLNPSLYRRQLLCVLHDAGISTDAKHTLELHEVDPIGPVLTKDIVETFRRACVQHALYGRISMWLIQNGRRYTQLNEHDPTNMLPTWHRPDVEPTRNWKCIRDLCACTDSAYIDMGGGEMKYYRQVLMNSRPAWIFETSMHALLQLDTYNMPSGAHIVPCDWKGIDMADFKCKRAVVAARKHAPPPAPDTRTHYVIDAPADTFHASKYMTLHGTGTGWTHRTSNAALDSVAGHAFKLWMAMHADT